MTRARILKYAGGTVLALLALDLVVTAAALTFGGELIRK